MDGAPRGTERHFAELIAQKQRLQQLESEYALKIQKLKEAQALRNKEVPQEPPLRNSTPPDPQIQIPPPSSPFPVPQPSLHDLTQDKLTLDSEDAAEADDQESELAAVTKGPRRRSLRQSSCSFTKPHLEQLSSTPAKDSSTKPGKTSGSSEAPAEMFAGLDVDALKLMYQQQPQLGELLQRELQNLRQLGHKPPPVQVSSKTVKVGLRLMISSVGGFMCYHGDVLCSITCFYFSFLKIPVSPHVDPCWSLSLCAGGLSGAGFHRKSVWEHRPEASSLGTISQPSAGLQIIQVDYKSARCTTLHSSCKTLSNQ